MKRAYLFWGLLLFCLSGGARADTLSVAPDLRPTSLTPILRLLEDPTGKLKFEQLQTPEYQAQLQPWSKGSANFGFTRSAYWVAFTLRNPIDRPLSLLIRQDYPLIDHLDFWAQDENGMWRQLSTGDRLPFDSRAVALRDFVFPVELPPQSQRTYYLRYASQGSLNIGLSVSSDTAFLPQLNVEQLLLGIYYGGFLVLVFYNFFLFMAVRDKAYVYYMCYAISYGLYFGVHNGVSFQFVWPDNPWLANHSLVVLLGLSVIFGAQFVREVCSGSQLAPRTDKLLRLFVYLMVSLTAIAPFASYRLMIPVFSMLTLVGCMIVLVMGTISLLRGSDSARYLVVGWTTVLSSVIIFMLKTFGWLPHNGFTHNAFQVGALIEMVLLSLALGARVREIQKLGYTDELSRLYNRRFFDEHLPREFDLANRSGTSLSLLVLDLDHFKAINDRYGHRRGDLAIRAVGQLIEKHTRKPALACRYGGEEFALVLPRTTGEQAAVLAERLARVVAELDFHKMPLTISIGVASLESGNCTSAVQLFEAADAALYRAKKEGRNRVAVAQPKKGKDVSAVLRERREEVSVQ